MNGLNTPELKNTETVGSDYKRRPYCMSHTRYYSLNVKSYGIAQCKYHVFKSCSNFELWINYFT